MRAVIVRVAHRMTRALRVFKRPPTFVWAASIGFMTSAAGLAYVAHLRTRNALAVPGLDDAP